MVTTIIKPSWLPQVCSPLSHQPAIQPKWPSCLSSSFDVTSVTSAYSSDSAAFKVANNRYRYSVSMATTTIMHMWLPQVTPVARAYVTDSTSLMVTNKWYNHSVLMATTTITYMRVPYKICNLRQEEDKWAQPAGASTAHLQLNDEYIALPPSTSKLND